MKKLLFILILLVGMIGVVSAENCSVCSETCSPCGGGCTATTMNTMYQSYNWTTDTNGYGDITGWDVSCITTMLQTFAGSTDFNQDISGWNTSSLTDTGWMFQNNVYFNQPIGLWDTSNLEYTTGMFSGATAFDQDIGTWNMSSMLSMGSMFNGVTLSTSNYDSLLNGWAAQAPNLQSSVLFAGGSSQYTSAAIAARTTLNTTYSWTITDGGLTSPECEDDNYGTICTCPEDWNAWDGREIFIPDNTVCEMNANANSTFNEAIYFGTNSTLDGKGYNFTGKYYFLMAGQSSNQIDTTLQNINIDIDDYGGTGAEIIRADVGSLSSDFTLTNVTVTANIDDQIILLDVGTSGTVTMNNVHVTDTYGVGTEVLIRGGVNAIIEDSSFTGPINTTYGLSVLRILQGVSATLNNITTIGGKKSLGVTAYNKIINNSNIMTGMADGSNDNSTQIYNTNFVKADNVSITDNDNFLITSADNVIIENNYFEDVTIQTSPDTNALINNNNFTLIEEDFFERLQGDITFTNNIILATKIISFDLASNFLSMENTTINNTYNVTIGNTYSASGFSSGQIITPDYLRGTNNEWFYVPTGTDLDRTASLRLENIPDTTYVPYKDGSVCLDCTNIVTVEDRQLQTISSITGNSSDVSFLFDGDTSTTQDLTGQTIIFNGTGYPTQYGGTLKYVHYGVTSTYEAYKYDYNSLTYENTIDLRTTNIGLDLRIGTEETGEITSDGNFSFKVEFNGVVSELNFYYITEIGNYSTFDVTGFSNYSMGVNNTAPSIDNYTPITPTTGYTGSTIVFFMNASDAENDTLYYSWFEDAGIITGQTTNTYSWITDYNDYGITNITGKVNDTVERAQNNWNVSLSYYPTTLTPTVASITATTIRVDWVSNANSIKVYVDDVLKTTSTGASYTIEGLSPSTQYEIMLLPIKDGYQGQPSIFNVTTLITDNNAPVMNQVLISPTTAYTSTVLSGACRATDIDTANIYYDYVWYVNSSSVRSGTTSLVSQGVTKSVGSVLSTNYVKGDNVTLKCTPKDGLATGSSLNTSIIISNSQAEISEIFLIEYNATDYVCNHTYIDDDDDSQITPAYAWYKNGIATGNTTINVGISEFIAGDEIVCQVTTGDGIADNITANSSTFTVGDTEDPVLSLITMASSVETDESFQLKVSCSDDVGIAGGYPLLVMLNPNTVQEQYSFVASGDPDVYVKSLTFSIAGTYTNLRVYCSDGNGNIVDEVSGNVVSSTPEVIVTGGGGGGGEEPEFRELTSFSITPTIRTIRVAKGQTILDEFVVENQDIVDIDFAASILRSDSSPQSYAWMTFEDGSKTHLFTIKREGGLATNNAFLRYVISVPETTPVGRYSGVIEVNGLEQTEQFLVEIEVVQPVFTGLQSFLNTNLFTIPFTSQTTPTGEVTGEVITGSQGKPFKVWHLIITVVVLGLGTVGYFRLRRRAR